MIVQEEHFVEAQACLRKLNQDLQFYCSPKARAVIFTETFKQKLINDFYKPWQSFQLGKTIKATKKPVLQMPEYQANHGDLWKNGMDNSLNNFHRELNPHSNLKTYKEVITSKHPSRDSKTPNSLPTSEVTFTTTTESNAVRELRQNVDEMQISIKFLEDTITLFPISPTLNSVESLCTNTWYYKATFNYLVFN